MLSNKAIAEASKISESTVSKFFHGEMKDPSAHVLGAICDTIGASVDRACGIVRRIDEAMTDPTPNMPAVVTDVVQTVSDIVDEEKLAERLYAIMKAKPIPVNIDLHQFAREIAAALPAEKCASCKSAAVYESVIAFHRKLFAILGGSLGLMTLFLMILIIVKK